MSDERFRRRLRDALADPGDLVAAKVSAVERVRRDLCPRCDEESNHGWPETKPECCGSGCFQSVPCSERGDDYVTPRIFTGNSCCPDCPWRVN